jgi:two-component system, NtrC family, sensor kinase
MRFRDTLTFRVFLGSFLLLFALFAVYAFVAVRLQSTQAMSQVLDSADRVSDLIKNSTRYSMLLNRREDVHEIINTIGKEPGIEGIRIYNKRGMIMFSTDKSEQGSVVDMRAEACFGCHGNGQLQPIPAEGKRTREILGAQGHRFVGLINPIRNEPACSNADCHAHPVDRTVLGVLDVRLSLEKLDNSLASTRRELILFAVAMTVAVAFASGMFLFFTVLRPVQKLVEGTRQISSGNLDWQILAASKDEVGRLAAAFNDMTGSLRKAEQENRTWSETLEERVQEKTEELRQIHERILQIEKMASLGKLSATVAHELNNPLEGILTYAKLIARRLGRMEDAREVTQPMIDDMEIIIREVQRCGNIVKNLLLFSRRQVGDFALIPVQSIVERAVQLMQHHFRISNVEFQEAVSVSDATLMCDENQIQQALVALFVNAVEAMPNGGTLRLGLDRTPAGEIRIQVTDSGVGIAEEDLPHLFEPFFSTKKEGQGVGLGLSIVYGIIERHGGTISVQSGIGKGTTFTLSFPPTAASPPRVEEAFSRTVPS